MGKLNDLNFNYNHTYIKKYQTETNTIIFLEMTEKMHAFENVLIFTYQSFVERKSKGN